MNAPRWYFDETTIGQGIALSRMLPRITWPGDDGTRHKPALSVHPMGITRGTPDELWLPKVGQANVPVITQDFKMTLEESRPYEYELIQAHACHVFAVKIRRFTGWDILRAIVVAWPNIEALHSQHAGSPGAWWIDAQGRIKAAKGW